MGMAWRGWVVGSAVVLFVTSAPALAAAVPDHEMPFPCSQRWTGSTRAAHSPSSRAIDFNRPNDLGDLVLASAPGVVSRVENLGNRSYGRWVMVEHSDGHSSLYAHLRATWVRVGQRVDQGAVLGVVGSTGGSTGPHLHFEERVGSRVRRATFHRSYYRYGTRTSLNCSDVPVAGNWNGAGADEVGVFRRVAPSRFRMRMANGTTTVIQLGRGGDVPVTGDWDGDATSDVGVWRPRTRTFLLRDAAGAVEPVRLGQLGDVPVTGDWDGDATSDVGVWRPATRSFRLLQSDGTQEVIPMGAAGSRPITGDWNGDGLTEVGVFNAGTGMFVLRRVDDGAVTIERVPFGTVTSLPVVGDWNGDSVDDLGTWAPGTATFSMRTADGVPARSRYGLPRG
jgi:murein DD-endopeptidase MepM/ murein hydrolase activator NlpD